MSYCVQYGTSRYDKPARKNKKPYVLVTVIGLLVLAGVLFSGPLEALRQQLLPYFQPAVQEAFGKMVTEIGEGASFSDAAAAFCREVIFEAAS